MAKLEFGLDSSQAQICSQISGYLPGCPKHLSVKGFRELLKALPKAQPDSTTAEVAVVYVGVILILYVALLALFVRSSLGRFLSRPKPKSGRRHVVTLNPSCGVAVPVLAEHYPTPSSKAVRV